MPFVRLKKIQYQTFLSMFSSFVGFHSLLEDVPLLGGSKCLLLLLRGFTCMDLNCSTFKLHATWASCISVKCISFTLSTRSASWLRWTPAVHLGYIEHPLCVSVTLRTRCILVTLSTRSASRLHWAPAVHLGYIKYPLSISLTERNFLKFLKESQSWL